jgi:Nucleotidyltransferase domain
VNEQLDLVPALRGLLLRHPNVEDVRLVGSRASGSARPLSDWDFVIATGDPSSVARDLPGSVAPLRPLATQWDPLGPNEYSCFMLLLDGPTKVDLILPGLPHRPQPPWIATADTIEAIDRHFWDWILWLGAKEQGGNDALVVGQLRTMTSFLLRPMGASETPATIGEALAAYRSARDRLEVRFGVRVPRTLEAAVLPAITAPGH